MSEDTQKVSTAVESSGKSIFITFTSSQVSFRYYLSPCSTIKFEFGANLEQNLNWIYFNEKVKFNNTSPLNLFHTDLNKKYENFQIFIP